MKIKVIDKDKIMNEKGEQVGALFKQGFRKIEIYCFLCDKLVPSKKHFEEEH